MTVMATSRWVDQTLPGTGADAVPGLKCYSICHSSRCLYYRLGIERQGEMFWYLYAMSLQGQSSLWVVAVTEDAATLDLLMGQHIRNELPFPPLHLADAGPGWLRVVDGELVYPRYSGCCRFQGVEYRIEPRFDGDAMDIFALDENHIPNCIKTLPEKQVFLWVSQQLLLG